MEKETTTAILVKNASKSYGNKLILDNLNLHVEKGIIYGLLGASGCGKTTLLSCIVGRKKLNSGDIWVLGGSPGSAESGVPGANVGYMPQDVALVGEFTVKGAVYYFGRIFGMNEELIEERFNNLSKLLDLPPPDRYVRNCSGGQQRRVSFAAAMVSNPELMILDEPTVGLDPVLRDSIWSYLLEITEQRSVTVIITTHYIEETRQAHKIGLLRQGKLLAEESPESLLSRFNTASLEEVFLILSQRQTEGRLREIETDNAPQDSNASFGTSSNVSMVMTELNTSREPLEPKISSKETKRTKPAAGGFSMNSYRLKALFTKNWIQFYRHPIGIFFTLIFPTIEILCFLTGVGDDIKNIRVAYINHEDHYGTCKNYTKNETVFAYQENECSFRQLGCRMLEYLHDPMMELVPYMDLDKAQKAITHGDVVGALYIPETFSHSLEERLSSGRKVTDEALNNSQIQAWLDMSNRQIGTTIKFKLIDKIVNFQKLIFVDCNFGEKFGELPIKFNDGIYGNLSDIFRIYMTPGVLLTLMFFMGSTNTSSIIISDRLEGVWDRSIVAGVSSLEIIFTHFVSQFILVVAQASIVIFITFVIFKTEFIGSFNIIVLLILLQGLCGMSYGFLVSVVSSTHSMANIVTTGGFYPMIILCGLVWPLEGMPVGLRWFSECLPFTIPIKCLRNVIKKGWGISNLEVANGIIIEIVWIIIFGIISALELRRKR